MWCLPGEEEGRGGEGRGGEGRGGEGGDRNLSFVKNNNLQRCELRVRKENHGLQWDPANPDT